MKVAGWAIVLGVFPAVLSGCSGSDEGGSEPVAETKCNENLSNYDGDCLALRAPDPAKGFQLHFGPTNYDDTAEVAPYLLQGGDERVTCLYLTTPNDQDVFFSEYHATVRPGTHHMIIWAGQNGPNGAAPPPDGTLTDECRDNLPFLVGAQNGIGGDGGRIDIPGPNAVIAPENKGLGTIVPAKSRVAFQVHYVNGGSEPLLRESWANFIYKPKETISDVVSPMFWLGGLEMSVDANSKEVITAECRNDGPDTRRIVSITGHMHAHATRFSAYKVRSGSAARQLVYQEFEWQHSHLYGYDSVNKNPSTDPVARTAGAVSGELLLEPGDSIQWECEVNNTTNEPLKFDDQAYTAEMCNLFGAWTPGFAGAWNCFNR